MNKLVSLIFVIFIGINSAYSETTKVSELITAVVLGPIPGEYGYEQKIIKNSNDEPINGYFLDTSKPAILGVLEQLKYSYPNLKKISLSVGWYGDTLEAGKITIKPKVESRKGPEWQVAGYTRDTSDKITADYKGDSIWEGTPTDSSVVEICALLHKLGFEVVIYPFLFIDLHSKPWRGDIKAKSDAEVAHFLKENSNYILHYAKLEHEGVKLKDVIKGFILGTELEGLTKYRSAKDKQFIFVDGLVNLAGKVRSVVGKNVDISYAANWPEYHSNDNGWYHLDKLWQDKNIDFVGIDAYFPLTPPNAKSEDLSISDITKGWESGENYDYYIEGGVKKKLNPRRAIQDIRYWWGNRHKNPDGTTTGWKPKMKPIVFTEIGFTALDNTTADPFSYLDLLQKDLGLPRGSSGKINQKFQYDGILSTINFIKKINLDTATKGIVKEAHWYNIDPKGHSSDWIHSHELKVAEFERDEFDEDGKWVPHK